MLLWDIKDKHDVAVPFLVRREILTIFCGGRVMRKQSILVLAMLVLLFGSVSSTFGTTASFQGLGDLSGGSFYSRACGVSADGSTVVGMSKSASGKEAFRWTSGGGMVGLGELSGGNFYSHAYGISADGSTVVGMSISASGFEAFRWTSGGGMVGLGDLPGGRFYSYARSVSADGSVVVGTSDSALAYEAFRWTSGGGMVGLGDLPGGSFGSGAFGVSADGSTVVGWADSASGKEAFRWTSSGGMVGLGDLSGGYFRSQAFGVSADGSIVVGAGNSASGTEAFRWTASGGMVGLGNLPGGNFSEAYAVSADGSVIVGRGHNASDGEAFIWDTTNGMQSLQDMLVNDHGLDLTGWTLFKAEGISDDGLTIVGYGYTPNGYDMEAWIATIPEPFTPPIADADGPYTIYVGDTLMLDASGSTDDDNDIVSYMWDLDDNGSFETDAGSQAIFDVNYAYLQSLGLIVDHTYNIHMQVTDSEGQSDIADSTLIIVPKPALAVTVDIKPGSCPNPVNVKSSGVLPIAILGTVDYDATTIDPTSIRIRGVEPLRSGYDDITTPVSDSNDCNCITEGPDGFLDLTLKFETQRIVEAVGDVNDGDELQLELIGVLFDETPIEGADCILIRGRHKPINPADINKDGVVNIADFVIFAQNWLQSSIVDE
jgi:probable HAF family extracellular repeat protein